jgi:hypothetical protein
VRQKKVVGGEFVCRRRGGDDEIHLLVVSAIRHYSRVVLLAIAPENKAVVKKIALPMAYALISFHCVSHRGARPRKILLVEVTFWLK